MHFGFRSIEIHRLPVSHHSSAINVIIAIVQYRPHSFRLLHVARFGSVSLNPVSTSILFLFFEQVMNLGQENLSEL